MDPCPVDCIHMGQEYDLTAFERTKDVIVDFTKGEGPWRTVQDERGAADRREGPREMTTLDLAAPLLAAFDLGSTLAARRVLRRCRPWPSCRRSWRPPPPRSSTPPSACSAPSSASPGSTRLLGADFVALAQVHRLRRRHPGPARLRRPAHRAASGPPSGSRRGRSRRSPSWPACSSSSACSSGSAPRPSRRGDPGEPCPPRRASVTRPQRARPTPDADERTAADRASRLPARSAETEASTWCPSSWPRCCCSRPSSGAAYLASAGGREP